jgi:hypothetical protein
MNHHCHANDCRVPTNPKLFMCGRHWAMVPVAMQDKVWSTFRKRSAGPGTDPASWADYYEACADAVEYVATAEGKGTGNPYRVSAPNFRALAEKKKAKQP